MKPRHGGFLLVLVAAGALIASLPSISAQTPRVYEEQLRPQFHFSPAASFTNDPNGLVYYKGRYHLFYQQRVFTGATGLSCCDWGHAVSADLVRWEQRPVAIHRVPASASAPEEAIFSGSAVVDWGNTSGFGTATNPPLVAVYTGSRPALQTQQLAYSTDAGDTWQIYAGNPVLDIQSGSFRDPKVFWYEPLKRWTMVIYSSTGTRFYSSPNLKEWTLRSTFGTGFECPDFFPLAVDGERKQKWVLFEANGSYWVGDFDGATFTTPDPAPSGRMDHGTNYYAAQTFSDTPGRRLLISWISTGFMRRGIWPELPWMGAMTVARELSLKTIDGRPQIVTVPAAEVATLRTAGVAIPNRVIRADSVAPLGVAAPADQVDIEITIDPGSATQSGLRVLAGHGLYTTIGYDAARHEVYIDRAKSGRQDGLSGNGTSGRVALPAETKGKPIRLRVLVDRSTLEVYADGGTRVLSANVLPIVTTTLTSPGSAGASSVLVQSTTGFAAGQTLRVNADPNGPRQGMQPYTIADVGSGAINTTLAAPVAPGDTNLKLGDVTNFTAGRTFTIGSGSTAEVFTAAGEPGTAASNPSRLLADVAAGATTIRIANLPGLSPGAVLVVDAGDQWETVVVAPGGVGIPERTTTAGSPFRGLSTAITLASPLAKSHGSGAAVRSLGTGIRVTTAATRAHPQDATVSDPGTGLKLTAPLTAAWPAGTPVSTPPATGLEAFATGGAARITSGHVWRMKPIWK